jgi:adenylate kinase family enzyme
MFCQPAGDGDLRIVIIGSSGSGKTTLAKALGGALGLPFVELDAIQWQPDWQPLVETDREEFIRRVDAATAGESWVVDGNYGAARHLTWGRATHLVWLDYERPVIMWRVIRRSLVRSVLQTELWAGNREQWRNMLRADHPIWWAWKHWRRHRVEYAERLTRPEFSHLEVLRVRRPREAEVVIRHLSTGAARP